jgi:hypothetical protein
MAEEQPMKRRAKIAGWSVVAAVFLAALLLVLLYPRLREPVTLRGTVILQDMDPRLEAPIAGVKVHATSASATVTATSDSSGFFMLTLPLWIRRGQPVTFQFEHAGYWPLTLHEFVSDQLYVIHLLPVTPPVHSAANEARTSVANVRVRYSIKTMTTVNIGSVVKTFQVQNTGNVPCKGHHPCSPNGKWKAATGAETLDAGPGNEFQNTRASCIAGPCPFTKIEKEALSDNGEKLTVSARTWSDTATFLLEAEVFQPMISQIVHQSYPVIFGRTLSFTLPSSAEGVSILADVNGDGIVFPLGPAIYLSWANCSATLNPDQAKVYRCELKPGYQFR